MEKIKVIFDDLLLSYSFLLGVILVYYLLKKGIKLINKSEFFNLGKILWGLFIPAVLIQNKWAFLRGIKSEQMLNIWLAIMTLYGIFIAFIQFLIGYSSQNENDIHWGRSITKNILLKSPEYEAFNSLFFRIILVYVTFFTLVNQSFLTSISVVYSNKILYDDIYIISIATIILIYVFLFLRSIQIKLKLFRIREWGNGYYKYKIEKIIKNEFNEAFFKSVKKEEFRLSQTLKFLIVNQTDIEKKEMVYNLLIDLYSNLNDFSNKYKEYTGSELSDEQKIYLPYRLRESFLEVWELIEDEKIILSFKKLLRINNYHDEIIYSTLVDSVKENDKNMEHKIIEFYFPNHDKLSRNRIIFEMPELIWNNLQKFCNIHSIINSIEQSKVMEFVYTNFENLDGKSLKKLLLEDYEFFIYELLNRTKEIIINSKDINNIKNFFNINNQNELNRCTEETHNFNYFHLSKLKKYYILKYLIKLENSDVNRTFIEKMVELIDQKHVGAFIYYRMLYPREKYGGWKKEVLFFEKLYRSKDNYNSESNQVLKQFIIAFIADTNISHRINHHHINWIFNNINTTIDEKIMKEVINIEYISLLTLIKFRYIMTDSLYNSSSNRSFKNISLSIFKCDYFDERYKIIRSFEKELELLEISYFFSYYYYFFRHCLETDIPIRMFEIDKCELFFIGFDSIPIKELFEKVLKSEGEIRLKNGIIDYLVTRMNSNEFDDILLKDENIVFMKRRIIQSIASHKVSIDDYVEMLKTKGNKFEYRIDDISSRMIKKKISDIFERVYRL